MGLLQKTVETYDAHAHLAGVIRADHLPLAPISHIITGANLEITLDEQGRMVSAAVVDKTDAKTIIPATEESAGRTSAPCAHPLCEQVGYLSGVDPRKRDLYLRQLESWADSPFGHPMLKPILTYVKRGTLLQDLEAQGIKAPKEKDLVRWRIVGLGETDSGPCWTNLELFQSFIHWYGWVRGQAGRSAALCMITGKVESPAGQHPKGIIPINGNAKLISANDSSNFTYKGRFTNDAQAATVSYTASQKAHNALRWLVAEQGTIFGGRTFLCWNPQGKTTPMPTSVFLQKTAKRCVTPTAYKAALRSTLEGYRSQLPENSGGVVIAAFDAATTGRLALTYYAELRESDFLQRLHDWDDTCCWWSWNPETGKRDAIMSPALWQIVNCAFGTQQQGKLVTDDRLLRQQIQRLLSCRVDKARFPRDIKDALVHRAFQPQSVDPGVYEWILTTACAVVRKYHYDQCKEEISMSLDENCKDRSYQYGRLLAVLEKAERDTYSKDESREPNATRMQAAFCRRPLHTAKQIESQLEQAYFPKLKPGSQGFYKNLIGEIFEKIAEVEKPEEMNKPLGDTFVIGYYLQRNALYTKKQTEQEEAK